jgi:hypothetical protein
MTDECTLDRLMAPLRAHFAEARRLELEGADQAEVEERRRLILRLQQQLAYAVRDLLTIDGEAQAGRALKRPAPAPDRHRGSAQRANE